MNILIKLIICTLIISTAGCQNILDGKNDVSNSQQEYILSKVNNYSGLIKFYRDKLNKKENVEDRYKLAKYYYLVEDYNSSRLYLKPLLNSNPGSDVLLLESKNLLEQGNNSLALSIINRVLKQDPENGEAWNIQGILMAQVGNFDAASKAFDEARTRFIDEEIVVNNMAMLAIMQENYSQARDLLIPLYMRGQTSTKMLHNLVFVLVKLQDFHGAESVLSDKKMNHNKDGLLEALAHIRPYSREELKKRSEASLKIPFPQTPTELIQVKNGMTKSSGVKGRPGLEADKIISTSKDSSLKLVAQQGGSSLSKTESASLSVTGNLKEIHAVRAGQHPGYFRMTLESKHGIKFKDISGEFENIRRYELFDIKLTDYLLSMGRRIAQEHSVVKGLKFYQNSVNTLIFELELERRVIKNKTFNLSGDNLRNERLVFDLYF